MEGGLGERRRAGEGGSWREELGEGEGGKGRVLMGMKNGYEGGRLRGYGGRGLREKGRMGRGGGKA